MSRKSAEIDTKSADTVSLGGFVFLIKTKTLQSVDGTAVQLRSQSAEVLAILAENAGRIVSKDVLIEKVWAETFVTDDSLVQCIADIRRALGERGREIVQTFPKKGYVLHADASAEDEPVDDLVIDRAVPAPTPLARRIAIFGTLAAAGIALLFFGGIDWSGAPTKADGIPRIAVLPFDDFSVGDDKGYLSDAIAEGIITELARSKVFAVIARNSSFQYRDSPLDVRQIGEELGVDYILEGSQQKNGEGLHVTVQLIDARSGHHIWAHTYEQEIGDLFVVQDNIIRTAADRVGTRIERPLPVKDNARVSALHFYLMGIVEIHKNFSAEGVVAMRNLAFKAIEADPESEFGYIGLAWAFRQDAVFGWNGHARSEALTLAEQYADKALMLAPDNHEAHYIRARLHTERAEIDQAILRYDRAIELNPSDSSVMNGSSGPLLYVGRTDEAIARIRQAMGIDPFHPDHFHWQMSWALWEKGDCEASISSMRKMSTISPGAQRMLAAALACLGKTKEATKALAIFLEGSNQSTLAGERARFEKLWTAPGSLDRWIEHLRIAGMPE